jgi:hypothetical protein
VSGSSDLYSIGVILYELLTGVVPFEGETAVAIAFKQVSAEPYPPSALNHAIPPSLDAVVLRALAKDPAHRYANADELIAALEHERQLLPALAAAPAAAPCRRRLAAARAAGDRAVRDRERTAAGDEPRLAARAAVGPGDPARSRPRCAGGSAPGQVLEVREGAERDRAERTGCRRQAAQRRAEPAAVARAERDRE